MSGSTCLGESDRQVSRPYVSFGPAAGIARCAGNRSTLFILLSCFGAWATLFVASAGPVSLVLARDPAQMPEPHFGVTVELVNLFATVHDRSGKLVMGLRQEDFVVYDNGLPQTITQFSREYIPLSVLILLDTSGSMAGRKLENACRSLSHFLRKLNPGDEAMLLTIRSKPRIAHPFTQDVEEIKRSFRGLQGSGATALYDSILVALEEGRAARNRRRALLVISDGINTYGRARLVETIAQLQRAGIELFAIGFRSESPESHADDRITETVLDQLTRCAGGEAFIVGDPRDLGKICDGISERMHKQYTFGYYPARDGKDRWHRVEVATKIPGLKVVASKKGYYSSSARK